MIKVNKKITMNKDSNVKINNLKVYQKYLLALLLFFDDFCNQHGIDYSLIDGTLLGAVRDKSIIPWDDDIDVCVTHANLLKLKQAFKFYSGRYELSYISKPPFVRNKKKDFQAIHCQIIDKKCSSQRYNIDIFTVDYLGDDYIIANKLVKKYRLYFKLSSLGPSFHIAPLKKGNTLIKNIRNIIFDMLFPLLFLIHIPFNYFFTKNYLSFLETIRSYGENSKYYSIEPFLGRFGVCDDNILCGGYTTMALNGFLFKVFKKYDIYLRATYGNYMIPPPKKERHPYHSVFGKKGIEILVDDELSKYLRMIDNDRKI